MQVSGGAVAIRILKMTLGVLVLMAGIVLLVLPGPGILVMLAGLALLGIRFQWVDRMWEKYRNRNNASSRDQRL